MPSGHTNYLSTTRYQSHGRENECSQGANECSQAESNEKIKVLKAESNEKINVLKAENHALEEKTRAEVAVAENRTMNKLLMYGFVEE